MLTASLLQTGKGISTASTPVTARAAADLPLLHLLSDIAFTQVVMQGRSRFLQDHKP